MKRFTLLALTLSIFLSAQASLAAPTRTRFTRGELSSISYRSNFHSCYRWMTNSERDKWIKTGKPVFVSGLFLVNDPLLRLGKEEFDVLFCWLYPAGGLIGGRSEQGWVEEYGKALVRVDFVGDAVVFDRNLDKYFTSADSKEVPAPTVGPKDVNTELVYSNYSIRKGAWFQEILIRSENVIAGWSFGDSALQENFREESEQFLSDSYLFEQMHFFANLFTKEAPFFSWTGRPYYEKVLKDAKLELEEFWKTPDAARTYINPTARPQK